jgi:hypothetical protein
VDDADLVGLDPEGVRHQLGEGRLVALTVGETPVRAVTRPSGSTVTSPYSDPNPVTSTYTDRPTPS